MNLPILSLVTLFSLCETRVTFKNSEVLQVNDLVNNAASFNCDNGCKVYVDKATDQLQITQNGKYIANFVDVVGNNSFTPDGLELPAAKNYILKSRGPPNPDFVFYAVSRQARNYGAPVVAPQAAPGISVDVQSRYFTLLSSANAIRYTDFKGSFPAGFPKIYSTGYDAVGDGSCNAVYQARSQYNAQQSQPSIFSPILTVDFGYIGKHTVNAYPKDGKNPSKSAVSSVVYMSPGYVGCLYVGGQYYSNVKNIQDSFSLVANSFDINTRYNALSAAEPVRFHVNQDTLDFSGGQSSYWAKQYGPGSVDVSLSWTRMTTTSSWAIQLDFGEGSYMSSSPRPPMPTTSSGGTFTLFFAAGVVLITALL